MCTIIYFYYQVRQCIIIQVRTLRTYFRMHVNRSATMVSYRVWLIKHLLINTLAIICISTMYYVYTYVVLHINTQICTLRLCSLVIRQDECLMQVVSLLKQISQNLYICYSGFLHLISWQ